MSIKSNISNPSWESHTSERGGQGSEAAEIDKNVVL